MVQTIPDIDCACTLELELAAQGSSQQQFPPLRLDRLELITNSILLEETGAGVRRRKQGSSQ
eukprot:CAMPEP_0194743378 /NCGR_PEP_ID=MMETSP0296-20130528/100277_1 /TAXON_ID=39354 /ORGANISM="Heterosigma akashiwo, Strain CCMP2393" /LENGTH=61 /DNA_ID=CAMNT_0039655395 /DNA_START=659 /DNA_END=841 /DNA_ORIENTATION=+